MQTFQTFCYFINNIKTLQNCLLLNIHKVQNTLSCGKVASSDRPNKIFMKEKLTIFHWSATFCLSRSISTSFWTSLSLRLSKLSMRDWKFEESVCKRIKFISKDINIAQYNLTILSKIKTSTGKLVEKRQTKQIKNGFNGQHTLYLHYNCTLLAKCWIIWQVVLFCMRDNVLSLPDPIILFNDYNSNNFRNKKPSISLAHFARKKFTSHGSDQ